MQCAQTFLSSGRSCLVKENIQGITHNCKYQSIRISFHKQGSLLALQDNPSDFSLFIMTFWCSPAENWFLDLIWLVFVLPFVCFFCFKQNDNDRNSKQRSLYPLLNSKAFTKFSAFQMSLSLTLQVLGTVKALKQLAATKKCFQCPGPFLAVTLVFIPLFRELELQAANILI